MYQLKSINFPHDLTNFSEIIDVRTPAEYEQDHIPGAINLPALSNSERAEVGTIYKSNPFEARKLGAGYISKNVSHHLANYLADKGSDYRPLLYCWRGGMRSRSMAFILQSIGWNAHVVSGGYRAFRRHVIIELENTLTSSSLRLNIFSGMTGVGKTRLLHAIQNHGGQVLDLEALANHKGSLLGSPENDTQPSQKQFETRLWNALKNINPKEPVYTEAESNRIGNVHCPPALWSKLSEGKVIDISLPFKDRVKLLLEDYPHFTANPAKLSGLLEKLVRLRGKEQVSLWRQQIEQADWSAFMKSILSDHYDLAYRMPGDKRSNYPAPTAHYELDDCSAKSYDSLACTLLNLQPSRS